MRKHGSALISGGKVLISHIEGGLYCFTPTSLFSPIAAGDASIFLFTSERWMVARTDMYPNWYVSSPLAEPRILRCTASEQLKFFAPLKTREQYKRTPSDRYEPWSPEQRYKRNEPKSVPLTIPAVAVVPTPRQVKMESEMFVTITSKWCVYYSGDTFKQEANQLAGNVASFKSTCNIN